MVFGLNLYKTRLDIKNLHIKINDKLVKEKIVSKTFKHNGEEEYPETIYRPI
jgi:hypothetical protein